MTQQPIIKLNWKTANYYKEDYNKYIDVVFKYKCLNF